MALETRSFSRVGPNTPPQVIFEDLGYVGNGQDQFIIPTDGVRSFNLTINDDASTNGGNYAAAFLVTVDGSFSAPQTFAYVDFTNFAFQAAARELADYYSDLGYVVYDDSTSFRAQVNAAAGEQFVVTVSGSLHDDQFAFRGGSPHPISYTVQVTDPIAFSGGGGITSGTDFNDLNSFASLGRVYDARGGLDIVTFQNGYSAYQVDVVGNNRAFVNGVELINNERLDFADGTLALDVFGNAGQVYRLYQAAFDREPDFYGLSYNVDAVDDGMNIRSLAQYFTSSPEFNSLYGQNTSNATFINALYENVLDRGADAGGFQYWNAQMNAGLSRGEVLLSFSESAENIALVAPQIDDGIWLV